MKDWEGLAVTHWAALGNSKAILDRLLIMRQCKMTVDMEDNYRRTPLWHAACHGHLDCVHILLVYGPMSGHERCCIQ
jgi:ankyrin repeat protein